MTIEKPTKEKIPSGEQSKSLIRIPHDGAETIEQHLERADIFVRTSNGGKNSKYTENEDGAAVIPGETPAVIVVDGVGSCKTGSFPAKFITENFEMLFNAGNKLADKAMKKIANEVFWLNVKRDRNKERKTGATAVIAAIHEKRHVEFSWIGDCKALTVRAGHALPEGTTRMHNVAAAATGDTWEYMFRPNKNIILRLIGNNPHTEMSQTETIEFQGEAGDTIIVASDGLWDVVSDYEIADMSSRYRGKELHDNLFDLALSRQNAEDMPFDVEVEQNLKIPLTVSENQADNITIAVIELK